MIVPLFIGTLESIPWHSCHDSPNLSSGISIKHYARQTLMQLSQNVSHTQNMQNQNMGQVIHSTVPQTHPSQVEYPTMSQIHLNQAIHSTMPYAHLNQVNMSNVSLCPSTPFSRGASLSKYAHNKRNAVAL
jgi:hypothetical protein